MYLMPKSLRSLPIVTPKCVGKNKDFEKKIEVLSILVSYARKIVDRLIEITWIMVRFLSGFIRFQKQRAAASCLAILSTVYSALTKVF